MHVKSDPDPALIAQLKAVQAQRASRRQTVNRRSVLDPFRHEIQQSVDLGASLRDITDWLLKAHNVHVAPTTVSRRLTIWAGEQHENVLDAE